MWLMNSNAEGHRCRSETEHRQSSATRLRAARRSTGRSRREPIPPSWWWPTVPCFAVGSSPSVTATGGSFSARVEGPTSAPRTIVKIRWRRSERSRHDGGRRPAFKILS